MDRPLDRMEQQGAAFHARVRRGLSGRSRPSAGQDRGGRCHAARSSKCRRRFRRIVGSGQWTVDRGSLRTEPCPCNSWPLSPMSWHRIRGHDDVVERFRRALGCAADWRAAFLFAGPAGVGKRTFALKLAQALLCQTRPEEALDPCGTCPSCVQVARSAHPDLDVVGKPADKSFIPRGTVDRRPGTPPAGRALPQYRHETQPGRAEDRHDRRRRLPERRRGQLRC